MTPAELSKSLIRIAKAIENSKNPDKQLVERDLRRIIAKVGESYAEPVAEEFVRLMIRTLKESKFVYKDSMIKKIESESDLLTRKLEMLISPYMKDKPPVSPDWDDLTLL